MSSSRFDDRRKRRAAQGLYLLEVHAEAIENLGR
jgi:hypothetical protein